MGCCESERGLFSIAFAPWKKSRRFYVFFTDNHGDLRISEFKRKRGNPLRADEGSRRDLLDIRHRSAANHNGGQLQWGPDNRLYIATGDGGTGGGPAQSKGSLLGKILRINPLRRKGPGRYSLPRTTRTSARRGLDEIFARGLRNPWRFSLDNGKIVIGDVGEGRFEEVDYERLRKAAGANFGWNHYEGNALIQGPALQSHDRPIHTYSHSGGRCAITGGYVVRDPDLGALRGRYVYGDLCTGQIRSLGRSSAARGTTVRTGLQRGGLVSFGEDARRNVYVVAAGSRLPDRAELEPSLTEFIRGLESPLRLGVQHRRRNERVHEERASDARPRARGVRRCAVRTPAPRPAAPVRARGSRGPRVLSPKHGRPGSRPGRPRLRRWRPRPPAPPTPPRWCRRPRDPSPAVALPRARCRRSARLPSSRRG